jgi:KUP system potassium uptake protein
MSAPAAPQNPQSTSAPHAKPHGRYLARLSLLALGVVYGDIGTSPLYAMREAFHVQHGIPVTPGNVFGVLSLIVRSLVLNVTLK